jgi:hypothetical protein
MVPPMFVVSPAQSPEVKSMQLLSFPNVLAIPA